MIVTRLQGGLGNQMFQYAFGKMLAKRNNTDLKIDTTFLEDEANSKNVIFRKYDLDIFKLIPNFATSAEIIHFNGNPSGNVLQRLLYSISKRISPRNLVIQHKHDFVKAHLELSDNTCIVGRWQSELYFKEIGEEISRDFERKESWLINSVFREQILKSKLPVAVHVRREDYLVGPDGKNVKRHNLVTGTLDISYYKTAASMLAGRLDNPEFFIFSEDIEWSISNLQFLPNATFVRTEKSKKGVAEDMELITLCKHHIISNSTFSWWGAYLSIFPEKIVIAPTLWAEDPDFIPPYILPENWIRI